MPKQTTTERGYGSAHQATRKQWEPIVNAGQATCARCGDPLIPGQPWDLGHTDDRTAYTGPECPSCNRSAGGRNGAMVTNTKRAMTVRDW